MVVLNVFSSVVTEDGSTSGLRDPSIKFYPHFVDGSTDRGGSGIYDNSILNITFFVTKESLEVIKEDSRSTDKLYTIIDLL